MEILNRFEYFTIDLKVKHPKIVCLRGVNWAQLLGYKTFILNLGLLIKLNERLEHCWFARRLTNRRQIDHEKIQNNLKIKFPQFKMFINRKLHIFNPKQPYI